MFWSLCLALFFVLAWTASAQEDIWMAKMQLFVDERLPDNFEELRTM
jgi:hypothetical protein